MDDHANLEILATKVTVAELEAAIMLLQGDDKTLIDIKRRSGDRLHHLLTILANAEIEEQVDIEP